MLSSIIRWNATRTKLHKFYGSLACNNYTSVANHCPSKQSILQCITLKHNMILHRNFWNLDNELTVFLPLFPGRVIKRRSILSTIALIVSERVSVRPMIDENFDLVTITSTAKTAASKVSIELANQNYDHLEDLVEDTMLKMLRVRIDGLTVEQRKLIAIREEDIIYCNAGYLKIIPKSFNPGQRVPNVTIELNLIIAYMPLYGQPEFDSNTDSTITNSLIPLVANYIFSRDYTEDGNSDWIINYINIST